MKSKKETKKWLEISLRRRKKRGKGRVNEGSRGRRTGEGERK